MGILENIMGKRIKKSIFVIILVLFASLLSSCFGRQGRGTYEMADGDHIEAQTEDGEKDTKEDQSSQDDQDDQNDTEDSKEKEGKSSGHGANADPYTPYHGGEGSGNIPGPPLPSDDKEDEIIPIYDYFMDKGMYICKACYMPFADIASLNAHSCSGHITYECDHDWEAEYNDIWVEEKGHYEYGLIAEGYDEPVYEERCVCKKCGEVFLTSAEASAHIISVHGNEGSWTVSEVIVSYIHHEPVYGDVFIVDEPAHWERELYRYRCKKCGEFKYPE